ncbi:rRNA-processing protein fcf1 [Fusarium falciforme]|nr:rRNA-processing protein fcf1 [Fusarium falciforme]
MGVAKKTRKFAQVKRVIGRRDDRLKENKAKAELVAAAKAKKTINGELIREAPQMPSNMFFQHNTALVPPYNVLVDTNFINHTVQRKLSLLDSMMDCLYAKCNPIITSCVMSELEGLGQKFRLALRVARTSGGRGWSAITRARMPMTVWWTECRRTGYTLWAQTIRR